MERLPELWWDALTEIVEGAHKTTADSLPALLDGAVDPLGITAEIYLVDAPQLHLRPVRPGQGREPLDVEATLAGRAFRFDRVVPGVAAESAELWVPLLNGTERVGVLRVVLPAGADAADEGLQWRCWILASLLGQLLVTKQAYGDTLHTARRPARLSVAAEMLWQLLPPLTFATDRLVISAVVAPYERVGGDAFDYAVDRSSAFFAIYDAVGHDIQAGLTTALTLAATRNTRRHGPSDLDALARHADEVIAQESSETRFVTAVLAHLDVETGTLHYLNAGHPPPLLLRANKSVKTLGAAHRPPLGVPPGRSPAPSVEALEPEDRVLLYSDGITEARNAAGHEFGLDQLIDLTEQSLAAGLPAPETLRRLSNIVADHHDGPLRDDATLLLIEWSQTGLERILPQISNPP